MTAPVTLVVGPEELLAERAVSGLVAAARTTTPTSSSMTYRH